MVYLGGIAAIIIYVLRLVTRFVSAQERVATALETIARKSREDGSAYNALALA